MTTSLAAALPTAAEAVALAFPRAQITRREHVLSDAQVQRVKSLSEVDLAGSWWVAYEARINGILQGVAFIDTHRIRTMNETAMVAIGADGNVKRVELISFLEPQEYMPRDAWVRQLEGKPLGRDLKLGQGIRPLSGATLTARTLVDATRRGLALFQVLYGNAK